MTAEDTKNLPIVEGFQDLTEEALARYGAEDFWLNTRTLEFYSQLIESKVPSEMPPKDRKRMKDNMLNSILQFAPLAAETAFVQMLFEDEAAKPAKVAFARTPKGLDEEVAMEHLKKAVEPYTTETGDIVIPKDKVAAFMKRLVDRQTAIIRTTRSRARAEAVEEKEKCRDDEKCLRIVTLLKNLTEAQAKLITPAREDAISASRVVEEAFLAKALYDVVAPYSVWACWRITEMMNQHSGRLTMQATYLDFIRLARRLGQLQEDEAWDEDGQPVRISDWNRPQREGFRVGEEGTGAVTAGAAGGHDAMMAATVPEEAC